MDKQYIELEVPDSDKLVIVKLDDEGVVVDIVNQGWSLGQGNSTNEPIASTWKMYDELGLEVKRLEE